MKETQSEYFRLLNKFYGRYKFYPHMMMQIADAWSYSINSPCQIQVPLEIYREGELAAHVILIYDARIGLQGKAYWGFFECINDFEVFKELWKALIKEARKNRVKTLLGPVNATTWHQFSFARQMNVEEYFLSEPFNMDYYPLFFKKIRNKTTLQYHSVYWDKPNSVLKMNKPVFEVLISSGYTIEKTEPGDLELAVEILRFINTSRKNEWGFVPLQREEFLSMYMKNTISSADSFIYIARKDGNLAGYSSLTLKNSELIINTLVINPGLKQEGLGDALIYAIHRDAEEAKIRKVICSVFPNSDGNFPISSKNVKMLNHYQVYEYRMKSDIRMKKDPGGINDKYAIY